SETFRQRRRIVMTQIHPSQISMTVATKLALLLFPTLTLSLAPDLRFARTAAAQAGSATSANEMAGDHNAEQDSLPEAIAPTEEHAAPQQQVGHARPCEFP